MGFPLVSYCIAVPKPVLALCRLLNAVKLAFLLTLSLLGLYQSSYDHARLHALRSAVGEGLRPEAVKERLPAIEFQQLTELSPSPKKKAEEEEEERTCIVCLVALEAKDEVRRLGNCAHAFHRGCIDRWIDLGHLTCPLCRSHLLPRKRGGLLRWLPLAGLRRRAG